MTTYCVGRTSARITCKECGRYLGMDEGWYDKCKKCRKKEQDDGGVAKG